MVAPCSFAGDKLIDHLKHWMNPEEVSGSTLPIAWRLGEQPAVAAAILELFHLLPAQSSKFMETEGAAGCARPARHFVRNNVKCCSKPECFGWRGLDLTLSVPLLPAQASPLRAPLPCAPLPGQRVAVL